MSQFLRNNASMICYWILFIISSVLVFDVLTNDPVMANVAGSKQTIWGAAVDWVDLTVSKYALFVLPITPFLLLKDSSVRHNLVPCIVSIIIILAVILFSGPIPEAKSPDFLVFISETLFVVAVLGVWAILSLSFAIVYSKISVAFNYCQKRTDNAESL